MILKQPSTQPRSLLSKACSKVVTRVMTRGLGGGGGVTPPLAGRANTWGVLNPPPRSVFKPLGGSGSPP